MLTLKEFKEARGVLSGVIRNTSLVYSPAFSKATGNQIYIKPELSLIHIYHTADEQKDGQHHQPHAP